MRCETIKGLIKEAVTEAISGYGAKNAKYQIEYPPSSDLGDYSCNVAMVLATQLKKSPIEIAGEIEGKIGIPEIEKTEVVKPGFINFYLSDSLLEDRVAEILGKKEGYGCLTPDKREKIQVEFVSANPTGPLTLANARGGFSGDVLANVLALAGHEVQREYYVNDYGEQVARLGHSILKDDLAQYSGEYIDDLEKRLPEDLEKSRDARDIGLWASNVILDKHIKPALEKAGIRFDNFFSEKSIHEDGRADAMLEVLEGRDSVYENEGATWLKTSKEGNDDKDRVLVKSSGEKTYFLGDIAYHFDKMDARGFDRVINLWGADHHGYVPRLKSAMDLLGHGGKLEILLMQLMRLVQGGKEVRMSKRKGVYVLLSELIDEVGIDATRFFFLMHANNKSMDFDLGLAKEKSSKNPVYYVQYAHARICSILAKAEGLPVGKEEGVLLPAERELIKEMAKWPELIEEVSGNYEVHKICFYAASLADKFHDFYEKCRVIENDEVVAKRLDIVRAAKQCLANVLACLGVSAPEKM